MPLPPAPKPKPLPRVGALQALLAGAGPLALAALLLLGAAVLWVAWRVVQPTPVKHLVIATGPEQGAYDEFAKRYLPLLKAKGVTVELRPTQGSSENLGLLRDARSGVHAAFVQGGAVAAAAPGAPDGPVESLGSMAVEPLWLFYREDSAQRLLRDTARDKSLAKSRDKSPDRSRDESRDKSPGKSPERSPASGRDAAPANLAQLAGWRIDTGPEGGGSGPLFRQLWADHGLAAQDLQKGSGAAVHGVLALVQGKVDALALVSAADAPLVQYLLRTPGVRLLDFVQAEAYARRYPFLRPLRLPRGVVDLATDQPPHDVQLVATTATLAARGDLHPALVQLLLQSAHTAHGQAGWFSRAGDFPQPGSDELPLAPEAERYYRSGPPWLQHYLPFWLANFVDRMWVVLLPLLAALLPLSRVVPPLVTLRLRSRVYRWYAHLRAIEKALDQAGPDLAGLRAQIESLDAQTEHIGVPLSFTNELYDLRGHIHMVRKRILSRQPGAAATA